MTRGWTLATAAVVFLAGCSTMNQPSGAGLGGQPMVDAHMTLHHSRGVCSAPATLAGSPFTVTLTDIGMTQMMSGIAPLGARPTLPAVPASVAAGQVTLIAQNMRWRTHELVCNLPNHDADGMHQRSSSPPALLLPEVGGGLSGPTVASEVARPRRRVAARRAPAK